jgi:Na+-translocating ferredoxin:NAD+ oxidoreductase subunit C
MIRDLFHFNGGVKPDYNKASSTREPIAEAPLPAKFVIPLHQSIGGVPRPLVRAGEYVRKGQLIGGPDGNVSSAVHASTSGTVKALEMRRMPHTSGLAALCVILEPDGKDEWIEHTPIPWRTMSAGDVRDALRDAGVVGLGGAVFPSYLKVNPGKQGHLDTLVINGAECEPFITCDDMQMRERPDGIIRGAAILSHLTMAKQVLIGVEDNKPEAIAVMSAAVERLKGEGIAAHVEVVAVPTRYPAGGAKQLIRVLTGIEVPHGKRSTDYGVQCFNTGTAHAVHDAFELGRPMISRIVTVAGNVERPRNFEVRFGMPMKDLVALCGPKPDTDRLIMGGPMMGFRMPGDEVPVVKATNCVLVGSPALFPPPPPEMPCIRCGECARACPVDLQPFEMYWFSRARIFGKAQEYHLFDCIECGCCAYVCPSRIPLVDYYRFAKSEIWAREQETEAADQARERYEYRLAREEREKQEKAAKLAAKAAETKAKLAQQAAAATSGGADPKKDLIATALARAQQQKAEVAPANTEKLTPEQQAQIAEAEARHIAAAAPAEAKIDAE